VEKFSKNNDNDKKKIYDFYLKNTAYINNWDLVDLSAYKIVGPYLETRSRKPLYKLAKSKSLWERRISILSLFHMIKNNDFKDALEISELLLNNKEDLMHKAVGWMLREIGNRNRKTEEVFLKKHYKEMPRTMLRYAIEKFPEPLRKRYLLGKI
jgi:3-methyladenine DNA glycosylase AlkD